MSNFVWLESFEIGVPEIDDDHRGMLAIMRRIEAAADAEDFAESRRLLGELMAQSREHFAREEAYLERIGYPELETHRRYHASLIGPPEEMMQSCMAMTGKDDLKACCTRMFGFLIDDVIAGDLSFKSYLDDQGLTQRC